MINLEENLSKLGVTLVTNGPASAELTSKIHEGLKKLLVEVGLEAFEVHSIKIVPQGPKVLTQDANPLGSSLCFCCTGNLLDFDCRWDPDCNCNN